MFIYAREKEAKSIITQNLAEGYRDALLRFMRSL